MKITIEQRLKEAVLIACAAFALFCWMSLLTFHASDPSFTHTSMSHRVLNSGGVIGAWFSEIFLYLFGYLAYLFPATVVYCAWIFRQKVETPSTEGRLKTWSVKSAGFVLILFSGCGLAALHFKGSHTHLPYHAGGLLGHGLLLGLYPSLNVLGSTLLFISCFLVGVTLMTGLSWIALMDSLGGHSLKAVDLILLAYEKLSRWRVERREVKEQEVKIEKKRSKPMPKKRKPPRIEPKIEEPVVKRVTKEEQMPLFANECSESLPSIGLLDVADKRARKGLSASALEESSRLVELKLLDFGVTAEVVAVHPGPVVTRFEIQLAPGVKVSKITGLAKDLARSLSVISVRVVEVIQGKSVIGLELPNEQREIVRLSEVFSSKQFASSHSPLTLGLGKDIAGKSVTADLAKMPHLLVAGTTGSGKSVGINSMLLSILYKSTPETVRLLLIDPKMLELSVYEGIPHLLTPVITDMKEAANGLRWCVAEMERRYRVMAALGVRNLAGYNKKVSEAIEKGKPIADPLQSQPCSAADVAHLEPLPFIVVVIDEFADMMMVVGKKVEDLIARIAQKARAAGIHMILATQRPSVDVITGLIKANVPSRIAFQVSSKIDSRTILDQQGAEQLLGYGDMLYLPPGSGVPTRVHGAFVDDHEVHAVADACRAMGAPNYLEEVVCERADDGRIASDEEDAEKDELYDQAVAFVLETRRASISSVQRKLKIGYNRAARIIEQMEYAGLLSPMESNGNREILVPERD